MTRLDRPFYARPAETVARDLLGKTLCVRCGDRVQRVRVVETEAYVGPHDLAAHTSKGRTPRTEVMFGRAGHAYVYFVYGMHDMLNVVTGQEGHGEAVLIRAAEPLDGVEGRMDGPALLARTLGVTVAAHNRADLLGDALWFEDGPAPGEVAVAKRVGVDYAGEWAAAPLRFYDPASRHVSRR